MIKIIDSDKANFFMMNRLYNFDSKQSKNTQMSLLSNQKDLKDLRQIKESEGGFNKVTSIRIEKISKLPKIKFKRKVILLCIHKICSCFTNKMAYFKYYNIGKQMLSYDLNVLVILSKLIEYEKIKAYLFDKESESDYLKVINNRCIDYKIIDDDYDTVLNYEYDFYNRYTLNEKVLKPIELNTKMIHLIKEDNLNLISSN